MSELPGIVIAGASGRMGKMLIESVLKDDRMRLVGALERAGHDWVGRDVGVAMGGQPLGVPVFDDPLEPMANAQAVIDFTAPEATIALSGIAAQARAAHIIGTTGMTDDQIAQLEPASRHSPIVRAGNMSLGVNLLVQLTRQVATALDEDFDIEVIEAHHHHKVDGAFGDSSDAWRSCRRRRGVDLAQVRDAARDGITGARKRGDIGFSVIRGGDIVGEHEVLFAGAGERIVLKHMATDRALFAKGALRAALWAQTQVPGQYDMLDVLGLRG